ncbi:MAG: flagellar biosynthesis protein FliQ [Rhodospirillales bacterium]|nr:flagellar biosynthesis protein FliQ [Rhodospirillales bacterium]
MTPSDAVDVAREAIVVALKIGAPVMLVSLGVGLTISLFQALTQIQEMTLSFVPKILVIFLAMLVFLPFMLSTLTGFTHELVGRIVTG